MKKYKIRYENILIIIIPFIFILLILNIIDLLKTIINQDTIKALRVLKTIVSFILNVEILSYIADKKDIF